MKRQAESEHRCRCGRMFVHKSAPPDYDALAAHFQEIKDHEAECEAMP